MPEESDPHQQTPDDRSIFGGASPDELYARAMQSVKMSGGAASWEAPSVEEASHLFPGYEVKKLIGRGGMGAVYQARQIELDRLVAIKLLPLEVSLNKDFADRFRREARAMARLHHPNIIAVHDFGTTAEGHLFFVMEYVEGANLHDIIHQVGLNDDQALSIAAQVCTALGYAHGKGIVHRDIKPANVMIDTESHVKVADFGLARLNDPTAEQMGTTMTGTVMGTPDYMAPEQTQGMNVDHRADIYSLGVMLYEMLCRQVPKGIFQPPSARVGCDARIDQIVIKAMQQAPEHRYQSTTEMKADVSAARTPVSIAPDTPKKSPLPNPPKGAPAKVKTPNESGGRNKKQLYVFAALGVLTLILVGYFVFRQKQRGKTAVQPPMVVSAPTPSNAPKEQPFVNSLGMKFVPVPISGGDTDGQRVLFSVWETRVQDYEVFAKETKRDWPKTKFSQGPTHPAVMVSWEDAVAFCVWLSKKEGRTYRLPTDAEWSFSVGLGVEKGNTPKDKADVVEGYPWGKEWPPPQGTGNYGPEHAVDSFVNTAPVGSFAANPAGLYDLAGNALEWCEDWFDETHTTRVIRGSSWVTRGDRFMKSSSRKGESPKWRFENLGFRCVLAPSSS